MDHKGDLSAIERPVVVAITRSHEPAHAFHQFDSLDFAVGLRSNDRRRVTTSFGPMLAGAAADAGATA
jgi:hypothetical protein